VMPQELVVDIRRWVDECNRQRPPNDQLILHCDGARLLHAAIAQNLPVKDLARQFHSVSMCLSKGVGAPIGSVLAGSHDFIRQARHYRKWMGGAWRHSSMVALAAKWALEHTYHSRDSSSGGRCLLARTHDTTRHLAKALETAVPGGGARPMNQLHTNMLYMSFKQALAPRGLSLEQLLNEVSRVNEEAVARGEPSTVVANYAYSFDADGGRRSNDDDDDDHSDYVVRMALHYQIDEYGCDLLAERMRQAYERLLSSKG
jgi:threonine aldolase